MPVCGAPLSTPPRLALVAALLALATLTASAAPFVAPHGRVWSGSSGSKPGWSVASIGDVDGNGLADFAIGDPLDGNGSVTIYLGSEATQDIAPHIRLVGPRAAEQFGTSIASVGDLDGDGLPDFAVGAPLSHGTRSQDARAGRVYVILAASLQDPAWSPALVVVGDAIDHRLGMAIAGNGDVDGDGVPDLLASAPLAFESRGLVGALSLDARGERRFSDLLRARLVGDAPGDELGENGLAMRGAAWLVGAPDAGPGGIVYLLHGPAFGSPSAAATRSFHGAPDALLGFDVALAHDGSMLLGAPGVSGAQGRVYVHAPDGALRTEIIGLAGSAFGSALGLADFDGDGEEDLAVGAPVAPRETASPGAVVLVPGPWPAGVVHAASQAVVYGDVPSGRFGFAVDLTPAPDATHEGGIVVGAPRASPQAHLLLNRPPLALAEDVRVPCDGPTTRVVLDGSASRDPEGLALAAFAWSDANGSVVASTPRAEILLPLGEHVYTLDVRDAFLARANTSILAEVFDAAPPDARFVRPGRAEVHVEDEFLLALPVPPLQFATHLGRQTFEVEAQDACTGVERVEFWLDDVLVETDVTPPYAWTRDPHALLPAFDRVVARAYDGAGNIATLCLPVLDAGWIAPHHLPLLAQGPPPVHEWNVLPPREPNDIIGAGEACQGEWVLPLIDEPVPVDRVLPLGTREHEP